MRLRLLFGLLLLPLGLRAEVPQSLALDGRKLDVAPKMVWWPEPVYPRQLLTDLSYPRGIVTYILVLDENGQVDSVRVMRTPHPALVPAVLSQVNTAKFAPGVIAGKAVATKNILHGGFLFKYGVSEAGGDDPSRPRTLANPPPEYAFDVAPDRDVWCEPIYPRELLLEGVKGEADVEFVIDETGRFVSGKVVSATRPEFGDALLAAVETWTFTPAARRGVATKTVIVQRHRFKPAADNFSEAQEGVMKKMRKGGKDVVELAALDHRPRAIYQVAPKYPVADEKQCIAGQAEVEFIISHTGQVVLPKIISASQPEFGWAAETAVNQWFYAIPTVNGKPVDVRVRMPLEFAPPVAAKVAQ